MGDAKTDLVVVGMVLEGCDAPKRSLVIIDEQHHLGEDDQDAWAGVVEPLAAQNPGKRGAK